MDEKNIGLYDPAFERDSCGIGFVANIKGIKDHNIVIDALTVLSNMKHRGASGSEANSGDGAGILTQIPHEFFVSECLKIGIHLPDVEQYGVGFIFFPQDEYLRETCKAIFSRVAERLGLEILGFRKVPTLNTHLGATAISVEPYMEQVFIAKPDDMPNPMVFERKLFVLRKHASHLVKNTVKLDEIPFYISSLSYKTIVYKGQFISDQVLDYFPDLQQAAFTSAFALVHSRFATNTSPTWGLAQPFRYLAHNGEINTIQGNINWLKSNEKAFYSKYFTAEEMEMILPVIGGPQSDSASLDNMIELLTLCGRSLPHVMMMLVPEAWDGNQAMEEKRKAFYRFHACLMEPWDGPAALCFTDGKIIGATLDRNGLRPSRYYLTKDNRVILSSEVGTLEIPEEIILEKGKLKAGKMFLVDTEKGCVVSDEEIKNEIIKASPYEEWIDEYQIVLRDLPDPIVAFSPINPDRLFKYQKAFGYTQEDISTIIQPMAIDGKEPIGSMGMDAPLAVLSNKPQHLSSYFKQLFAQVTNPPIDPLREKMVMSLATFVGNPGNILEERPESCHSIALKQPILSNIEIEKIRSLDTGMFQAKTIQCYFKANGLNGSLKAGLDRICRYALDAVLDGFSIIILSDRGIDSKHAPIPTLLAVSAIHHFLIRKGKRGKIGLVVEAGDVWEVHHFACLIGFGATAINPYLALSTIGQEKFNGNFKTKLSDAELRNNYLKAVNAGLLKVFSKMGISTLQSYNGAQIFEIIGLNKEVVNLYFTGATSRIQGLDLDDIAKEALAKHFYAFDVAEIPVKRLPEGGVYQWKRKGEAHLFNPETIHLLQHATRTKNYKLFKKYSQAVDEQTFKAVTLRSFFNLKKTRPAISIDEVESAQNIFKRFATGAMSFGSISWEAHTTLAIAMNRIGGKSNTGEGGEDPQRYDSIANGDSMRSAIKQVASGRFGVTSEYLTEADEIQIKMAQGAKPGEGGQLPGYKVDEWIGKTRHSTPGVGLISPPPHHDIYSIEDLAQLILDLKKANRDARINVKLVSKAGVGTIAAGVAKAKADVILVSGFDGGTGASPISSLRHAGLPWELGLAEAQQTLVKNKLRSRVVLQADGQLKTGRDIAIATLLGAEEWGISTAALVVEGCIMMRKCHLNTCPVGVATQNKELRNRFSGEADHVVTFFEFIVKELREIMAELGFKTINEMVGQTEVLQVRNDIENWKHQKIDFNPILFKPELDENETFYHSQNQDHELKDALDWQLLEKAQPALINQEKVKASFKIKNTDRTVGTLLSNELTKIYRSQGLQDDTIHFQLEGHAGQSLGAFLNKGITLELAGDANDYYGKGLSGGKLIVYPPKNTKLKAENNIIIGNTVLYGATSGEIYVNGKAGERFAVRNSGATAVVEGINDHGCEYMTGGIVLILGETGKNFGAGMSGGIAYVLDEFNLFSEQCNLEMIDLDPCDSDDIFKINQLLENHLKHTNSEKAKRILADFESYERKFVKVFPKELKRVLHEKTLLEVG